jgi:anhydro-N-acetylmuramic acid kinase
MIVAGVMSGTSADGIDVAFVRILGRGLRLRWQLLGHAHSAYPPVVRRAVLDAMNASHARVADLARLNFLLGELYADAVTKAGKRFAVEPELIGCHGQTLYHQGDAASFLGRKLAVTWQTGEGAVVAARTGVPVVSDFRPADMAAGGKGAPLVPYVDYLLYRHARRACVALNLGGIANVTIIPAGAQPEDVIAFDTGPGNMVIDALMQRLFHRDRDTGGAVAARGRTIQALLEEVLRIPFFAQKPPRTAGREQFGREFVEKFLRRAARAGTKKKEDVIATATALTAASVAAALRRFAPRGGDLIASGGGTRNRTLMRALADAAQPLGYRVRLSDDLGLPAEAKEAAAFAILAYQTWHRQPSNLPSATGAARPAILGKISHA